VQPLCVVTLKLPLPPVKVNDRLLKDSAYVHDGALCEMVQILSPMVIVPERARPLFASTE
jgi:hypothetical protein